ncbi:MAG: helicase-associated domain-containing protein [Anaerolineae bacterium]|nr:helicase-associated domain-containing protein [Anaerolineae bacterium]
MLECMSDHDTVMLRAIAERRGVEPGTSHQPDLAAQIAEALLDPASVAEALDWLSEREREAIDALLVHGGRMRLHRFEQLAGPIRRFGPGSLAREAPWRSPVSAAEGLWYRGLISRSFAEEGGIAVEFAFIPSDLRPLLPPPSTSASSFDVPRAEDPFRAAPGDPSAIDDVCTLLALAYAGALAQHEGQMADAAVQQAQAQLLDPDRERLAFLYHTMQSAGLVQARGRAVHFVRDRARDWLSQSRPQQLRVLQEAWRGDNSWNDLWHVPSIHCEETGWHNDPVAGRASAVELLGRCPGDAWLSIEGFVDAVRAQAADFMRPDGDFDSWYIRDARSGAYLMGFEYWAQVEGALLTYLLTGPLHWLGLISLGYREGWEKPTAMRITPWGAAFLGRSHAALDELPLQAARVSPDGVVTIPRTAPLSDRIQLARIAEWRASGQDYVYALTPTSVGLALGDGIEVARIERFLMRISDESVPAAALARMRSWASRFGQVRLRRATILETQNPQVMQELRADGRIRPFLRHALSPTIAVVREADWRTLIQELHRLGYLPQIIEHG